MGHSSGYVTSFIISALGCGWGSTSGKIEILKDESSQLASQQPSPVSCIQTLQSSYLVFMLRGGGIYTIYSEHNHDAEPFKVYMDGWFWETTESDNYYLDYIFPYYIADKTKSTAIPLRPPLSSVGYCNCVPVDNISNGDTSKKRSEFVINSSEFLFKNPSNDLITQENITDFYKFDGLVENRFQFSKTDSKDGVIWGLIKRTDSNADYYNYYIFNTAEKSISGVVSYTSLLEQLKQMGDNDGIYPLTDANGRYSGIGINASAIKTGALEISKTLTNDEGVSTNIVLFKADTTQKDDLTYAPIQIGNFEILDGSLNCKNNTYNFSMGTRGIYLGDYFKFSLDGKEAKIKNIDFSSSDKLVINNSLSIKKSGISYNDWFFYFGGNGILDLHSTQSDVAITGNQSNAFRSQIRLSSIGTYTSPEYKSITFTCYAQKKPKITTNKNADRDYNITITYTEWDWWQTKDHTLTNCLVLKKGTNSVEATTNIVTYGASAYSFAFIIDGGTDHKITINPITPFPDDPNKSYQLQLGWNGYKYLYGSGTISWIIKTAEYKGVPAIQIFGNLVPVQESDYTLGYLTKDENNNYSEKYFWKKAYISEVINKDPSTSNSDRSLKKDIEILSDNYNLLYDDLKPVRYKFIQNKSDRYHTGFISQDVEESLKKAGLTTKEFAGFVKYNPDSDETYGYGLRYEEFIALNTDQIQKLKKRVATLEQQLKLLEDKKGEN